jgi:hypothetical protein
VNGPYALRERSVRFSPGLAGAYPNSAGDEARDLVAAVLGGENLAVVTDADIVLMAHHVQDEGRHGASYSSWRVFTNFQSLPLIPGHVEGRLGDLLIREARGGFRPTHFDK